MFLRREATGDSLISVLDKVDPFLRNQDHEGCGRDVEGMWNVDCGLQGPEGRKMDLCGLYVVFAAV